MFTGCEFDILVVFSPKIVVYKILYFLRLMVVLVHEKLVIRRIYLFHDIKLDQYMEFPAISYSRVLNLAEIVK